jgi:hypothetical protein
LRCKNLSFVVRQFKTKDYFAPKVAGTNGCYTMYDVTASGLELKIALVV